MVWSGLRLAISRGAVHDPREWSGLPPDHATSGRTRSRRRGPAGARRLDRPELGHVLGVHHRHVPADALDLQLDDHIGAVQADLRHRLGCVVDLGDQRRAGSRRSTAAASSPSTTSPVSGAVGPAGVGAVVVAAVVAAVVVARLRRLVAPSGVSANTTPPTTMSASATPPAISACRRRRCESPAARQRPGAPASPRRDRPRRHRPRGRRPQPHRPRGCRRRIAVTSHCCSLAEFGSDPPPGRVRRPAISLGSQLGQDGDAEPERLGAPTGSTSPDGVAGASQRGPVTPSASAQLGAARRHGRQRPHESRGHPVPGPRRRGSDSTDRCSPRRAPEDLWPPGGVGPEGHTPPC